MAGRVKATVQQGADLPPKLPLLVVCGSDIDEQLILQQHMDMPRLHATPAAVGAPPRIVGAQVIQHTALVPPSWFHLDGHTHHLAGHAHHLHLEGGEGGQGGAR